MAALTIPLVLRRRVSHRRSVAEYLSMGALTVAIFTASLLIFERATNVSLVSRIFEGTIGARTRADYSVSFVPRIKPQRATLNGVATPAPTSAARPAATASR